MRQNTPHEKVQMFLRNAWTGRPFQTKTDAELAEEERKEKARRARHLRARINPGARRGATICQASLTAAHKDRSLYQVVQAAGTDFIVAVRGGLTLFVARQSANPSAGFLAA